MNTTQAIFNFLKSQRTALASFYNPNMEVQVNVRTDVGEKRVGEFKGKSYIYFSDNNYQWKSFRIPSIASYDERDLAWPLDRYADAIGLTGWNYRTKCSTYVGFDFDSIVNHKKGLTDVQLNEIKTKVSGIPWITMYSSKSGRGLHLYVFFTIPVPTESRSHHIALSRAILSNLRGLLDFDFEDKVDTCGSILWIWHRYTAPDGLKLLKQGTTLSNVPPYDVERRRPKNFGNLSYQTKVTSLGPEHQNLINWFARQQTTWWWDEDLGMLVCHTYDLKRAHNELSLRGYYDTAATGKDLPFDQNCFAFPGPGGSWVVRRHNKGTKECPVWDTDSSGWTRCFFNQPPDLDTSVRLAGGVKGNNKYSFQVLSQLSRCLRYLGLEIGTGEIKETRGPCIVKRLKGQEILVQIPREVTDEGEITGMWAPAKGPVWERVFLLENITDDIETFDDSLRHVIKGNREAGWYLRISNNSEEENNKSSSNWIVQSKDNVRSALITKGADRARIDDILGQSILNPWNLVKWPFQPTYPGDRCWNVDAPQLAAKPQEGPHRTWDMLLGHIGKNLDDAVLNNAWCIKYNIPDGSTYLLHWITSVFRYPSEPLPYLFLYGNQNSGKSSLHEALALLFTCGVVPADLALTNQQGFNSELEGAIVCYIEETNISEKKFAYERIKDWVTGPTLNIHSKGRNPYTVDNTTHWIQCANNALYCPVLPGDTRINIIYVHDLVAEIPKLEFMGRLKEEAPAFVNTMIKLEIPPTDSRLRIPVLSSEEKKILEDVNKDSLSVFLEDYVHYDDGYVTSLKEFMRSFTDTMGMKATMSYTSRMVARQLPPQYVRGRYGGNGDIHIGNMRLASGNSKKAREGKLELKDNRLY